ncbi:fimbrial protein [Enterobacter asburiae]|uniref:fimbrial protein n=1 Tax=Enterobacter TaxID=547 RepID=UPI0012E126BB|nr:MULTISPECIES: fimbrial protein [Enterobacter]MEB8258289.1 fimbrial protein [Enterobacter asburiae]
MTDKTNEMDGAGNRSYRMTAAAALLAWLMALSATAGAASHKTSRAAGDQFKMNINITGTVLATGACTFNQGGTVSVDFGTLQYTTTGGNNALKDGYRQPLASGMTCTGDTDGSTVMTLNSSNGGSVDYQGNRLLPVTNDASRTQSTDLAIRLLVNEQVQDVNTAFAVDMQNPPLLEAEVVQTGSGSTFVSGATFSANATLTMAFN